MASSVPDKTELERVGGEAPSETALDDSDAPGGAAASEPEGLSRASEDTESLVPEDASESPDEKVLAPEEDAEDAASTTDDVRGAAPPPKAPARKATSLGAAASPKAPSPKVPSLKVPSPKVPSPKALAPPSTTKVKVHRGKKASSMTSADAAEALVGTLIGGRYRVESVVGRGSMGVVYMANHEELERDVAIKVLGPSWSTDDEAIQRFFREARATARLGHPNIVAIYDLGRLEDTRPYLVMPLLEGEHLGLMVVRDAPFDLPRVLRLLKGVAKALDAIHARGILHRDIKPENIFITELDDGSEHARVLDFGLTSLASGEDRITRSGVISGTPEYMAPEMADAELPDRRCDIYSLGVVAFEMLSGALPYDDETPIGILIKKRTSRASTLSQAAGKPFPEPVEEVMARVLSPQPDGRYGTASAFLEDLALAHEKRISSEVAAGSTQRLSWASEGESSTSEHERDDANESSLGADQMSGLAQLDLSDDTEPVEVPFQTSNKRKYALVALLALIPVSAVIWFSSRDSEAGTEVATRAERKLVVTGSEAPKTSAKNVEVQGPVVEDDVETSAEGEPPEAEPPKAEPPNAEPPNAEPGGQPEAVTNEAQNADNKQARAKAERQSAARRRKANQERTSASKSDTSSASASPTKKPVVDEANRSRVDPKGLEVPERDVRRAKALAEIGKTQLLRGRFPQAADSFTKSIQADPSYAPGWRGLGLASEKYNRFPEARRAYRRYLRLAPSAPDASRIRARLQGL